MLRYVTLPMCVHIGAPWNYMDLTKYLTKYLTNIY
jgi:hypothetical protein